MYLVSPEFVKEDNLTRLSKNYLIQFCYTEYPGKNPDYIIYVIYRSIMENKRKIKKSN